MAEPIYEVEQVDLQTVALYKDFLPKKVFDAHMHMYHIDTIPTQLGKSEIYRRTFVTPEDYSADMAPFFPGVEQFRMNMIPMVSKAQTDLSNGLRDGANDHVLKLLRSDRENVGCVYIMPQDSEETIEYLASQPGIRGLKCYCYGAGREDTESLAIGDFLPEQAWEVANEKHLPIILHMMRHDALSDPENFRYICDMTHRYPNAQLVLAHCARAFSAWTGVNAIRKLEDQGNIWFDMAAICESGPMMACILKNAGKRIMWGTDYPICMYRGRVITYAGRMHWLIGDSAPAPKTTIVAESLMALHEAAVLLDLDQTQLNDLFWNNANILFQK